MFTFSEGNVQAFRGDRYTGNPIDMIRKLRKLALGYIEKRKLVEAKIYDNRGLLPGQTNLILHWHMDRGTLLNYLPLYGEEFRL